MANSDGNVVCYELMTIDADAASRFSSMAVVWSIQHAIHRAQTLAPACLKGD